MYHEQPEASAIKTDLNGRIYVRDYCLSQRDNSSTIFKLDVKTNYGAKFIRGWLVHLTEA